MSVTEGQIGGFMPFFEMCCRGCRPISANLRRLNFIFTYNYSKKALLFSPSLRGEAEAIQQNPRIAWIASASPRNDEDDGFPLLL